MAPLACGQVGYPVASYPAAGPSHSGAVYPEVPAAGASYQPYAAPQPPILVPATHVVVCRHDHHHCHPERAACGSCHRVVVPEPHKESGLCACITAVGLVGSGCCILAWLPFCCNVTKDTVYRCPDCQAEITRRRAPFE
ncbi:hypothetical protein TSOC_008214 [Tetrabaena socialis]|uniref:LITAF domain-containing protein n=1 Tax=Tetrabaena socialis TaxID=47790 RepID=A0A2J7ZZ11_9CHLO|nr:hypothetical protein TSOC_008214 [Tetrabaena socialis]|eukprot:PNH05514.1 hypothetical protein TSOC_008214 [Tetrabaena socialis]